VTLLRCCSVAVAQRYQYSCNLPSQHIVCPDTLVPVDGMLLRTASCWEPLRPARVVAPLLPLRYGMNFGSAGLVHVNYSSHGSNDNGIPR